MSDGEMHGMQNNLCMTHFLLSGAFHLLSLLDRKRKQIGTSDHPEKPNKRAHIAQPSDYGKYKLYNLHYVLQVELKPQGFGLVPHSSSSSPNRRPPRLPDRYLDISVGKAGHCCSIASDLPSFSKPDLGTPVGSHLSGPTNSASASDPPLRGADRGLEGTSFIDRPSASTSKSNRLFLTPPSFCRQNLPSIVSEPHLVTLDKSSLDSTSSSSKLLSSAPISPPTDLLQSSPPHCVISPSLGLSDPNRVVSFGRPSPDLEASAPNSPSNYNIELHPVSTAVVSSSILTRLIRHQRLFSGATL